MSVVIKDNGARVLTEKLRQSRPKKIKVGVIGSQSTEEKLSEDVETSEGLTVAQVATAHEFGIGVPRRSWLRDYVTENERSILRRLEKIIVRHVKTRGTVTIEQGLDVLGNIIVGEIQERISGSIPPPNAPTTKERKGSETTLINTGQFRSSITFQREA